MVMTSVTVLMLAFSPGKVAIAPLGGVDFLLESRTSAAEQIAQTLAQKHYDVLGPAALASVLSTQEASELSECEPTVPNCSTHFARVLGAQSVIVGTMGRLEGHIQLEVKVYDLDNKLLASARGVAMTDDGLDAALTQLATALVVQFEADPAPLQPQAPPGLGVAFWAPVISGVVVIGAGTYMLVTALNDRAAADNQFASDAITETAYGQRVSQDTVQRNVGITGMSLGAASIIAGAIFGRPPAALNPAPIALGGTVLPGGGGVTLSGSF
jgi:hypothetical protein